MKSIEIKEKLIEDRITQIIYKIDNKESTYHLYELLKIEMYFFQFEINIEDKIKLKIL